MKKLLATSLSVVMIISSLVACGSPNNVSQSAGQGSSDAVAASSKVAEENQEQIVLKLWNYKAEIVDLLDEYFEEFTKENPNIRIETSRPGGTDYYPTVSAYLSSGEYPDLIFLNTRNKTQQYAQDYLLPLNDYEFINRFTDGAKDAVTFDGKTYTMPINAGCIGLLYNTKLFEKAGIVTPPQTIDEFREACEKLKSVGVKNPCALAAKDPETLQQIFSVVHTKTLGTNVLSWVEQMNAGTSSFGNDKIEGAFDLIDLLKQYGPQDPFSLVAADTYALYGQGEVGMMITGAWALTAASKIDPAIGDYSAMSSVPISQTKDDRLSAETSMGIGIIKQSKHVDACLKVLDWMSTKEGAKLSAEKLNIFMPITQDPTFPKLGQAVWQSTSNYMSSNNSYPWGYMLWVTGLPSEVGSNMQDYLNGNLSRDKFISACDAGWKKYATQ